MYYDLPKQAGPTPLGTTKHWNRTLPKAPEPPTRNVGLGEAPPEKPAGSVTFTTDPGYQRNVMGPPVTVQQHAENKASRYVVSAKAAVQQHKPLTLLMWAAGGYALVKLLFGR